MPRILHLLSNHKVTGPAELALDTARWLDRSGSGASAIESRFLPGRHPRDPFWIGELAARRGVRLVEIPGLRLGKHFHPLRTYLDGRILERYIEREGIDIVHCHMPNDHLVASFAAARLAARGRALPIVRTLYDGEPVKIDWRARRTLGRHTAHLICFARGVRDAIVARGDLVPPERIHLVDAPIDTERFDPRRRREIIDGRSALGVPPDAFTAGIVARMQTHRRFDTLLEAVRLAKGRIANFRFVIIGRGTHQVRVAREPVRRLGLQDTVIFAGYLGGDEYVAALLAMDVKVFLVPGSDGTCRAVREALAAGVPVIAARRGVLPEVVEDGVSGRIVDDTPENLASAMVDLARHRDALRAMSRNARKQAERRFTYERYVQELRAIYERVLSP